VLQHLTYPLLDNRTGRSLDSGPHSGNWGLDACIEPLRLGCLARRGPPDRRDSCPYAVPAHRADLTGLPPAFFAVGALGLLTEEDMEYTQRLLHVRLPTELHVYAGAFHGFDSAPDAWASPNSTAALPQALHPAR
jgi:acetyl esterase/lipase